ncbi:isochorismate synthase [Bibersteinia trehalosi]|uniref:isochorismate synthase n=1 Tax=Bibersteinia trehalosi TaxID=47735 RepID=UPI003D278BB0
MSVFTQLTQALSQQLAQNEVSAGLLRFSATVKCQPNDADLLSWLKGQACFPQMFWQQRAQRDTFVALGQVLRFQQLAAAEAFCHQHQVHLVGGIQFEGQIHFILPRLLLWQTEEQLRAELFGYADEQANLVAFLAQLDEPRTFGSTKNQVIAKKQLCSFEQWQTNIQQAISAIKTDAFDKVVLANATSWQLSSPLSGYDLLAKSRHLNQGCYHFLWAENLHECFIGSSPERLYLRQNKQLLTEALAGTVAVSHDITETAQNALWLLNDHKNLYENWLVVDDICTNLADCAGDIQVGDAHIKALKNVQHLRRFIQTELAPDIGDSQCLARIHPTAAVAGLPRTEAKQFIQQHEPFTRGWYAGTLGYFSPAQAEFCVTLRSALVRAKEMLVYAGAGIVAESEPESEWLEIERKALAMTNLVSSD